MGVFDCLVGVMVFTLDKSAASWRIGDGLFCRSYKEASPCCKPSVSCCTTSTSCSALPSALLNSSLGLCRLDELRQSERTNTAVSVNPIPIPSSIRLPVAHPRSSDSKVRCPLSPCSPDPYSLPPLQHRHVLFLEPTALAQRPLRLSLIQDPQS